MFVTFAAAPGGKVPAGAAALLDISGLMFCELMLPPTLPGGTMVKLSVI